MINFIFQKKDKHKAIMFFDRHIDNLAENKTYELRIAEHKEKRSLNANAYCWVLCEKLAVALQMTKEDVYRYHIKQVGLHKAIEIQSDAVSTMDHVWSIQGIGWFTEIVDYSDREGFVLLNLYYGSSCYNSKQMSRLIDNLVQDCQSCDIETLSSDKIQDLIKRWGDGE